MEFPGKSGGLNGEDGYSPDRAGAATLGTNPSWTAVAPLRNHSRRHTHSTHAATGSAAQTLLDDGISRAHSRL